VPAFLFIANVPALDFVNSEVVLAGARTDLLRTFSDLARWCAQAHLASPAKMKKLARIFEGTPQAAAALRAACALRRVLRASLQRVAKTGRLPAALAPVLARELRQPRLATEVLHSRGRLQTRPRWLLEKPRDLLAPVAQSAAGFFATADYSAIRKCENPACILFFYDTSKNHTRRWCSMALCGNRAKVAAFRKRR